MTRQKITDVAIELMRKEDRRYIGYDTFGLLQDVWEECYKRGIVKGVYNNHPANKFLVVLNALDRDKKRFKKGFILCCGGRADTEVRVRVFELIQSPTSQTKSSNKDFPNGEHNISLKESVNTDSQISSNDETSLNNNIHRNCGFALQSRVQSSHSIKMLPLTEVKGNY